MKEKKILTQLFNANQYLLNNDNIRVIYKETLNLFNRTNIINFL